MSFLLDRATAARWVQRHNQMPRRRIRAGRQGAAPPERAEFAQRKVVLADLLAHRRATDCVSFRMASIGSLRSKRALHFPYRH